MYSMSIIETYPLKPLTKGDEKVAQHQDSLHRLIVNRENSDYGKDVTDLRERVEEIIEELMMEYEGMFILIRQSYY